MKKDILNELSGFDTETAEKIAENAPELDKAAQKRILCKCLDNTPDRDEITVSGTERYRRPKYRSFAAAAAAVVLIGGIGGAFALGSNMKKNAPVESRTGLQTVAENSAGNAAAANEGTSLQEADIPVQTGTEEYAVQEPDCTEPADYQEYKAPEDLDDEQYEKWLREVPEQYRDVVKNLKPGEVIHLPCIPLKEIPTDTGETTTCPPQTTTIEKPKENDPLWLDPDHAEIIINKEPEEQDTTAKTVTEQPDKKKPDVYLTVLKPITGYWYSNRTPRAQYYFGPDGTGNYYDSNTCWGYHFHYTYDQNAGTIEYAAYNPDGTLSDTICDKGSVFFTGDNVMAVFWEKGMDGVQGVPEYFTPNPTDSMDE